MTRTRGPIVPRTQLVPHLRPTGGLTTHPDRLIGWLHFTGFRDYGLLPAPYHHTFGLVSRILYPNLLNHPHLPAGLDRTPPHVVCTGLVAHTAQTPVPHILVLYQLPAMPA